MVNRSSASPLHQADLMNDPLRKESIQSTSTAASSDDGTESSQHSKSRGFLKFGLGKLMKKSSMKKSKRDGKRSRKALKANKSVCEPISLGQVDSPFDFLSAVLDDVVMEGIGHTNTGQMLPACSTHSSASSVGSSSIKERRSVSFREISPQDIVPSSIQLTPGDIARSWWQPADFNNMSGLAWSIASDFPSVHQKEYQNFLRVVKYCLQQSPSSTSSRPKNSTHAQENLAIFESDPEDSMSVYSTSTYGNDQRITLDVDAKFLIPSLTRGLELIMTPELQKLRKNHCRAVVNSYRKDSPHHLRSTLHHQRKVALQSLKLSRSSKVLARITGEADACQVQ